MCRPAARFGVLTVLLAVLAGLSSTRGLSAQEAGREYLKQPGVRVAVRDTGLYRIPRSALAQASPELAKVAAANWALYCQGHPLPMTILSPEDAAWGEPGSVVFWGQATTSVYAPHNVYWLVGAAAGPRFAAADGAPGGLPAADHFVATVHYEKQEWYVPTIADPAIPDHWFMGRLTDQQPVTLRLDLPGLAAKAPGAKAVLRARLLGRSYFTADPDHRTTVTVAGQKVAQEDWDGNVMHTVQAEVPLELLKPAGNEVTLTATKLEGTQFDISQLDWVEVDYPRTFAAPDGFLRFPAAEQSSYTVTALPAKDVLVLHLLPDGSVRRLQVAATPAEGAFRASFADPAGPAGGEFVVACAAALLTPVEVVADQPSSLREAANGADYLAVSHHSLREPLAPLLAHRKAQGLRVLAADLQDVYDEFSYGLAEPAAIRDFVAYACASYQKPAPRFLLLVGDASVDFKGYKPKSLPSLLPTHLAYTTDLGDTGSDDWFACLTDADLVPALAVGRIPARSAADVETVVAKTLSYERNAAARPARALLVADDDEKTFPATCDEAAATLTQAGWQTSQLYLEPGAANLAQLRQELLSGINQGCQLVVYVGHAVFDQWAREKLLTLPDISSLKNGGKMPLVISLSCLDGWFYNADMPRCLGEEWLFNANGGAALYWAPTAMGYPIAHRVLLAEFLRAALSGQYQTIGETVRAAKANLLQHLPTRQARELAIMYVLFGDPAAPLADWPKGGA